MGVDPAYGKATAVKVQQHGQWVSRWHKGQWRIEPCWHPMTVQRRYLHVMHSGQDCTWDFQHIGAHRIRHFGLTWRQRVQRWVARARHALQHPTHGGGECFVRRAMLI